MLKISNLTVETEGKNILQNLNLNIGKNEIQILMGENGSGKSTLAQVIAGNPFYQVKDGSAEFAGQEMLKLKAHERAALGIFVSFQNPVEISGVRTFSFLRALYNHRAVDKLSPVTFRNLVWEKMKVLKIKKEFLDRAVNEGFSGGEKKKLEILQMLLLQPKLVVLDEIDSGLDVDALKVVCSVVKDLHTKNGTSFLIITHHARIAKYLKPDLVQVLKNGRIVKSGGAELISQIEKEGFKKL